jgi:hypothetical protein
VARHTENARQELQLAKSAVGRTRPDDPMNVHHLHVARALQEMATALADIYDKLQAMDKKLK